MESFPIRRIRVTPRGKRRVKVALDGEILQLACPLVFDVGPKPLLVMLPAPADRVAIE